MHKNRELDGRGERKILLEQKLGDSKQKNKR